MLDVSRVLMNLYILMTAKPPFQNPSRNSFVILTNILEK